MLRMCTRLLSMPVLLAPLLLLLLLLLSLSPPTGSRAAETDRVRGGGVPWRSENEVMSAGAMHHCPPTSAPSSSNLTWLYCVLAYIGGVACPLVWRWAADYIQRRRRARDNHGPFFEMSICTTEAGSFTTSTPTETRFSTAAGWQRESL